MRPRNIVALTTLMILVSAAGLAGLYIAWDRPLQEVHRVQVVLHAVGGRAAIGDRVLSPNRAARLLYGDEADALHLLDEGSPESLIQRGIPGDVVAQPPWEVYGDLGVYQLPHLFEEALTIVRNGDPDRCWLLTYRQTLKGPLRAVPIWVEFEAAAARWSSTEKSSVIGTEWWDEKVLKQRVHLWRIDVYFTPERP